MPSRYHLIKNQLGSISTESNLFYLNHLELQAWSSPLRLFGLSTESTELTSVGTSVQNSLVRYSLSSCYVLVHLFSVPMVDTTRQSAYLFSTMTSSKRSQSSELYRINRNTKSNMSVVTISLRRLREICHVLLRDLRRCSSLRDLLLQPARQSGCRSSGSTRPICCAWSSASSGWWGTRCRAGHSCALLRIIWDALIRQQNIHI